MAAALTDKSWPVRLAVAEVLRNDPQWIERQPREAAHMAATLVADRSPQVQQTMVAAVAHWPLEQAATVLLLAMRNSS